jgi:Mg-chelatase subunit ChlD
VALSSAHLLDPVQAAVLARAPRILAQAPALADVPAALASRLTVVLELPYRPGERPETDIGPVDAAPVEPVDPGDVVALLTRYRLADHFLDLGASRFAGALARVGRADALDLVESLVCRPRTGTPPPSQPPADTSDERTQDQSNQQNSAEEDKGRRPDSGDDQNQARDDAGDRDQQPDNGEEQPAQPPDAAPPMPSANRNPRRPSRVRLNGRHGGPLDGVVRGRRRRVVPVSAAGGVPDVLATLTAALPWQRHRRPDGQTRVVVLPEDLRGRLRRRPGGRVLIVIVDASGSMAQRMIRTAKGIALAALDQAYRSRSTVCIVVARGAQAGIGLPPTRSTARARGALRALPTGGGTPLASALLLAARYAARYSADQVEAMILTDGRANVGIGGDPQQDAINAAAVLAGACHVVRVDTLGGRGRMRWLREAVGASRVI